MKRLFVYSICIVLLTLSASAQENKLIKELESKHSELQKLITQTESLLTTTKKDVGSQLNSLNSLIGQINQRKKYINTINSDMESLNREINKLDRELRALQANLREKKKSYEASVQYLYRNRTIQERLMFILSADNLSQTYRRMRYAREYGTYQRLQGEEILKKQEQVKKKQTELRKTRAAKEKMLKEREAERAKLEKEEKERRTLVANLQKKQKGLQAEVNKKRREANQLNARIDKLIAEEIEKARKAAEAEARRAKAAEKKTETKSGAAKPATGNAPAAAKTKSAPVDAFNMSKADRDLSGTFVNNRGKLPMPVTGSYMITSRYGQYAVEGLKNVKLDNKGIDIQARPGAQARAIFNGKVAAVFQLNGLFNVLIRHGSYISVYCNLSSASVKAGDTVTTRQYIGKIFSNAADGNRTVLHFQLRKEKDKLNPEPWLEK